MAFEGLSEKLNATFKRLRGKGRLTEADVREGMREVRMALLEADVSYKVVKDFVASVTEKCVGADVLDSLTPAQQIIKIVNEELTALMGGTNARLTMASKGPTVVMMVGLQGAGKTTNGAKLAGLMRRQFGKRPLLDGQLRGELFHIGAVRRKRRGHGNRLAVQTHKQPVLPRARLREAPVIQRRFHIFRQRIHKCLGCRRFCQRPGKNCHEQLPVPTLPDVRRRACQGAGDRLRAFSGRLPDRAPDSFHLKFLARQALCRLHGKTEHVVTGISPAAAELHDG